MSLNKTGIIYADRTCNCVTGCSHVSPGCDNCWAEKLFKRFAANPLMAAKFGGRTFGDVQCHPKPLRDIARIQDPSVIFMCSQSDLFHPKVPTEFLNRVGDAMTGNRQHIYQVLTKRPERMALELTADPWPVYDFIWLGVTVESEAQKHRIATLRSIPAAVRFLSCEPLLGPLNLTAQDLEGIAWVIVGGESGSGARECRLEWIGEIYDACRRAGVAYFWKQWGSNYVGMHPHDNLTDRQFPRGWESHAALKGRVK